MNLIRDRSSMPPSSVHSNGSRRIFTQREVVIAVAGALLIFFALILGRVRSTVVLVTSANDSLSFPDMEASFAPQIPGPGILGILYAANPLDACQPLKNHPPSLRFPFFPFVIVARGECVFKTKVQHAQNAGFAAVIVYNNKDNEDLLKMSENALGIRIPAVFITKMAGDILLKHVGDISTRCYILPTFENTAWSVMAVSFISLLAVTLVLATFFFVRHHRLRHLGSRVRLARESLSMSSGEVKALPSFVFRCTGDGKATIETCAICLEDYNTGEKLWVLPCHHEFHANCIDQWLTTRRPFCPICKRDAHTKSEDPPASENTPLLDAASMVSIPIETHNFAGVQVSLTGQFHPSSVGSPGGSYVSSPAGSPVNVNAHVLSSQDTPDRSAPRSPGDEQHSSSFDASNRLPNGLSFLGQCTKHSIQSSALLETPEHTLHHFSDSSQLSQSFPQLEFSSARQNGLGLRGSSYTSSSAPCEGPTLPAPNPQGSSQQYHRAGSLDSLHYLSAGS